MPGICFTRKKMNCKSSQAICVLRDRYGYGSGETWVQIEIVLRE